jgi:hypothetical protein
MDPKAPGCVWLLRELRRVEWRRLLLAVALLSAWGRALVPLPAQAASASPEAIVCSAAVAGAAGADGTGPDGPRACPLCRLADSPAALLPPPPAAAAPSGPERAVLTTCRPTPRLAAAPWHKLPRGPPERATTH